MSTETLHVRVDAVVLTQFRETCKLKLGSNPNDVLREMIAAAAEGRLKTPGGEKVSAFRQISTGQLSAFVYTRLHLQPIDVLVSNVPYSLEGDETAHLGAGFPLRCFQRLSEPNLATQLCP